MFHDTLVPCAERRNINMEMIISKNELNQGNSQDIIKNIKWIIKLQIKISS